MLVENWDSFLRQAEELYLANPLRTRYLTKYRHCDGKLTLKVTDDVTCLQFKTTQQADLKKIDRLNELFLSLMATGKAPEAAPAVPVATQALAASKAGRKR